MTPLPKRSVGARLRVLQGRIEELSCHLRSWSWSSQRRYLDCICPSDRAEGGGAWQILIWQILIWQILMQAVQGSHVGRQEDDRRAVLGWTDLREHLGDRGAR